MKKLLLIFFFSGFLEGMAQNWDSIPVGRLKIIHDKTIDTAINNWWVSDPPYSGCLKLCVKGPEPKPDTLRSTLLITSKTPGFAHTADGFCIQQDGWCIGHLDSRRRVIKLPVKVWGCLRRGGNP